MLSEDVEDQPGSVDDRGTDLLLQVALLTRREFVIGQHQPELQALAKGAHLGDLSLPVEESGVNVGPLLDVGPNHLRPRGPGQLLELLHLLVDPVEG